MSNADTNVFSIHHDRYEAWFDQHQAAYYSELLAIRALLPWHGLGLEIGVGTGRFAAPLGVKVGVDPSREMLGYALKRGISCIEGIAEDLPFKEDIFDHCLIVTTICFVDNPGAMLTEARRVLKPAAVLVVGFVDRTSALGRHYLTRQAEHLFYREARFYSASDVDELLCESGFCNSVWTQTLSGPLEEIREIEPFHEGRGEGAFVVVRANSAP
jgi:SAM-dependent methyltransferase